MKVLKIKYRGVGSDQLAANLGLVGDITIEKSLGVGTSIQLGGSTGPMLQKGAMGTSIYINQEMHVDGRIYPNNPNDYSLAGIAASTINTLDVYDPGSGSTRPIVVSAVPGTSGLMIVRGAFDGAGVVTLGEGFSVSKTGTGQYTVTYSTAFVDAAIVTATADAATSTTSTNVVRIESPTSSNVLIRSYHVDNGGTVGTVDTSIHFHAIGQRLS